MEEGSPAKAGEIEGERTVVPGELWPYRQPVDGSSAQAVDHEQRPAFSPEVEELDRPVQVYSPMPHCVILRFGERTYVRCGAGSRRIVDARRMRISTTAACERRPSLCSLSNTSKDVIAPITSSASLSEQPGRS